MPRKLEIDALQAEEAGLGALLEEAKSIDDPVGAVQYAQRLNEIRQYLQHVRTSYAPTASVALFFSGTPVLGSVGIASDFAGRALRVYQDLINKTFAKSELGGMGERGPVPLKQDATLMVTGVTHGSFGFVLNELSDQTEIQDTALKEVVTAASGLLESVSATSETEFENISQDLDPRTLKALRKFFSHMDTDGATIRIVDDRELILDEAAIHRGRVRTEATDIDEVTVEVEGILKGLLPERRRFELVGLDGQSYYGPVSKEATEQFQNAIASGDVIIEKRCKVGLIVRTVKSLNKVPRLAYRLAAFYSFGNEPAR
jgi:hypothetical protein